MATTKMDGGPAFARPQSARNWPDCVEHYAEQPGMSLRDYFAAHALMGMASSMAYETRRRYLNDVAEYREVVIAYKMADAMLAEREK